MSKSKDGLISHNEKLTDSDLVKKNKGLSIQTPPVKNNDGLLDTNKKDKEGKLITQNK